MKVSIIILNYNGENFLDKCLTSIKEQTYSNIETILFDNVSQDQGVALVEKKHPWVKVIRSTENLFFAKGNNEAAKHAHGDYLFFLNNDTWLDPRCIEELVEAISEGAGAYAPKIMNYQGKEMLELGMAIDKFGFPFQSIHDNIFYAEGSALFIRRELFNRLGGFDEKLVMIAEDTDLCWRLRLIGLEVKKVPQAVVYHYGGATIGGSAIAGDKQAKQEYQTSLMKRYYGEQNHTRNILKNYSGLTLCWLLPWYLSLKKMEIAYLTLRGQFKVIRDCYLKALWWNLVNLGDTLKERKKIQQNRKVTDKEIMKHMVSGNAKWQMFRRVGTPNIKK